MAFNVFDNFIEIQQLKKELSAKSGNLVRYDVSLVAEADGQTEFSINLSTFDYMTDSVLVQSGRTLLSPTLDYTVLEHSIVLNEGVPAGRTIDIYVYKNVENLDEEKTISGLQIAEGSIPLNRLNGSVGGQLKTFTELKVASEDDQKVFTIDLDTFVETADTVMVQAGHLMLFPDEDFTVSGNTVTLVEGVHSGCTVGIYIFKQVEHTDVDYAIAGVMIEKNSMPIDRLSSNVVTCDVPMHMSVTASGGLRITYDDGN